MKRWHVLLGSSLLLGLSVAAACGESGSGVGGAGGSVDATTGASGSKAATGATSSTKAATSTAQASGTTPASGSTGAGSECSMLATYGECVGCFCEANADGCNAYFAFEDAACLCDMGTPCVNDCGTTYCVDQMFDGTACETCYNALTGMEMCFETAVTNCQADPTCNAYLVAEDAACGALPE